MNELRMYVEHLFEGRVMSSEMIDLKEEIYGNLMARYEDLVRAGHAPAEAIEAAKASVTSIDGMLGDIDASETGSLGGAVDVPTGSDSRQAAPNEALVSSAAPARASAQNPVQDPAQGHVRGQVTSAPVNARVQDQGTSVRAPRKKWPIALLIVVLLLFLAVPVVSIAGGLFFAGKTMGVLFPPVSATSGQSARVDGDDEYDDDDGVTFDTDGTARFDGRAADELLTAVVNDGPGVTAQHVDAPLADTAKIQDLVRALPMGQWLESVQVADGGMVELTYKNVPVNYDDEIDVATVYDVSALFAAVPEAQSVKVLLSESSSPIDLDTHVFSRQSLERRYGFLLTGDIVNEEGWKKLKDDGFYRPGFVDEAMDDADVD